MPRETPHDKIRVAARLANGFVLDLVKLAGFGRDAVDGLLLSAISQANLAQITRDPGLQRAYATLDQPPPDALRRPVSISAVANSLNIPFETARRRILALTDRGLLLTVDKGVILPQAPLNSPLYRMAAQANYELVRALYFRLRGIGLLTNLPRPNGPIFAADDPPLRLVIRMSSSYLLRLAEHTNRLIGDVVTTLIIMDLFQANTEHLEDTEGGQSQDDWGPESFVPDEHRRPVRIAALSSRLGIPQETVRRHLVQLVARGLCAKTPEGYLVPAEVLANRGFVRFMEDNRSHLQRLFGTLAEFGVVAEWERDVAALRGAA